MPKASAQESHQSNRPRLDNALLALRKDSRVLRHRRAFADCFGANPVASALGSSTRRDPGAAHRTYHGWSWRPLKTGTFYFARKRNFLLCLDSRREALRRAGFLASCIIHREFEQHGDAAVCSPPGAVPLGERAASPRAVAFGPRGDARPSPPGLPARRRIISAMRAPKSMAFCLLASCLGGCFSAGARLLPASPWVSRSSRAEVRAVRRGRV